jgi:hypothetical protein
MTVEPEEFKFTPKETATLFATIVLTGLAIAAIFSTFISKEKETKPDER